MPSALVVLFSPSISDAIGGGIGGVGDEPFATARSADTPALRSPTESPPVKLPGWEEKEEVVEKCWPTRAEAKGDSGVGSRVTPRSTALDVSSMTI